LLAGEPGIGKTRLTEEFAESAREHGAEVLMGHCYEGEWAPPYGPFSEAIAVYARAAEPGQLRQDLGLGAAPLARLVGALRERWPDIPQAVGLQPDEERLRLLDAVSQFLIAIAARTPVVVIIDDLHWADRDSIAMLRHVARFAPRHRLLIVAAYRDVEVDRAHPLSEALGALPRETRYQHLPLKGLERAEVAELLETIADQQVPEALASTISSETSGNPFFIREVLLHLLEEGTIFRRGGRWTSNLAITEMGIPEGVKQVIGRRVGRLSAGAQALLSVAAAFTGGFRLAIAGRVAGLDEAATLDGLDEALAAQILCPSAPETYEFTHALIRHTLYAALSPARQVRLHRQIAETMEEMYGARAAEHAAEIAEQYHRSAALPDSERGVQHCLIAASRTEKAAAYSEAASFLQKALELLPVGDNRRPRILGRLGLTFAWSLILDQAVCVASEAGDLIAVAEGDGAAAEYLAEAAEAVWAAGFSPRAWPLAEQGLRRIGSRRDLTWARLMSHHIAQLDATDPDHLGIPLETSERRTMVEILYAARRQLGIPRISTAARDVPFRSRAEALSQAPDEPLAMAFWAGDYRAALRSSEARLAQELERGQFGLVAIGLIIIARLHSALGDMTASVAAYGRATALLERLGNPPFLSLAVDTIPMEHVFTRGEGYELMLVSLESLLAHPAAENQYVEAALKGVAALAAALVGHTEDALRWLATVVAPIERAPGWSNNYTLLICMATRALWEANRGDHVQVIRRNLHEKTLVPDFRYPHTDARLAMAQLCALQTSWHEAVEWFSKARDVLDDQGAHPLRAIVDFDEALMYQRRGAAGDAQRAAPLLEAAIKQFRAIGMPGWIKRAEELRDASAGCRVSGVRETGVRGQGPGLREETLEPETHNLTPDLQNLTPDTQHPAPDFVFRKEGDYWTVAFEGTTFRLKDAKGLHYLAYLLRHPGHEFHALDLMMQACPEPRRRVSDAVNQGPRTRNHGPGPNDQGPLLDAQAKAAYRRRLDDLHSDLAEAEHNSDLGRAAKARAEIEFIAEQFAAAVGLGGRDRPAGADAERARLAVTKGIKAALQKIRANHPAVARHLAASIKTGAFCSYSPDQERLSWVL
jgi:hypothetical protein